MDLKTVRANGEKKAVRKRVGRGPGSGLGKTAGKGHKGQRARSGWSAKAAFEGGQMPLYRLLPKRGFSNSLFKVTYTTVNVSDLSVFEDGADVNLQAILAKGLVSKSSEFLKILGDGEISKRFNVTAHRFSATAREKIEKAGGKAIEIAR
ncbi:MAG: 50S ribosomal protein L15 [Planctomycetes bacterium]|nr:50S ribosomal protein L15 [Planctomycetota bacterium]